MFKTILLSALCVATAFAGTVKWSGAGGNGLWSYGPNWNTNVIPTADDDVLIQLAGNASVTVSAPASAKSITIGDSTTDYKNQLIIQSSLTVGSGGVKVNAPSAIVLQAAPNSPFSSAGDVSFNGSDTFFFLSGAITGSGAWNVLANARIDLTGAGEKLITATTLYNYGQVVISQSALVQLEQKGGLYSTGLVVVVNSGTFLSQDGTGNVDSKGTFSFYSTAADTLTFQAPATFDNGISVTGSGSVVIRDMVTASGFYAPNATVIVAGNGVFELDASTTVLTTFNQLSLTPGSATSVTGPVKANFLDFNQAKLANSGSITANTTIVKGGSLGGVNGQFDLTDVYFAPAANVPFQIDSAFTVSGKAWIQNATSFLLDKNSVFRFATTSQLIISAGLQFQLIGGSPNVTIDGAVAQNADVYTNVNIAGSGAWTISGFNLLLQAVSFASGDITCNSCAITAAASKVAAGSIFGKGTGHVTIQANPTASFGNVEVHDLTVTAGVVTLAELEVTAFNLTSGSVSFSKNSGATSFSFYGGSIANSVPAKNFNTTSTYFYGLQPKTVSNANIVASKYGFNCGSSCTIVLNNSTLTQP